MSKLFLVAVIGCLILTGCAFPATFEETIVPIVNTETALASQPSVTATLDLDPSPTKPPTQAAAGVTETKVPDTPNPTRTPAPPTLTPTPDPFVYHVQPGTPLYSPNIFHPDLACGWTGVAGQVFGQDARPINNIAVRINGDYAGIDINLMSVTGSSIGYGDGGYEITLGTQPVESVGSLWIQLFDMSGSPVSAPEPLLTKSACEQALLIVNFVYLPQLPPRLFLPAISK